MQGLNVDVKGLREHPDFPESMQHLPDEELAFRYVAVRDLLRATKGDGELAHSMIDEVVRELVERN
ncbi:MAG: hypothetical protein MI757_02880 [Pirellulales bacterium]|nr:hypothetical protein [Pirellulales bacterium]